MSENFDNIDDSVYIEDKDGIITVRNLGNASFRAQMEKLPQNAYGYYKTIKSAISASDKVLNRTYIGKECFYVGSDTVAKFNVINNELYFYVKLSPAERGKAAFFKTPAHAVDEDNVLTLVIVKSGGDLNKSLELVSLLKQKYDF